MEYIKKAKSVYYPQYHVVWVYKYRRRILNPGMCGYIRKLKSQSASQLRKKYFWLAKVYWNENIVWSPGFFVSSAGVDEETIKRYVEYQGRQDSGQLQLKLYAFRTPGLPVGIYTSDSWNWL